MMPSDITKSSNTQDQQPGTETSKTRLNRIFIIDTNVLIHDVNALFSFKGVVIGIPFIVLEELDGLKREAGERGHNAREAIRRLDDLRKRGHLRDGVYINHNINSILKVYANPEEIKVSAIGRDIHDVKDNVILQTVADLVKEGKQVTLVTKDINVRLKADALGLEAEDYTKGTVSYDDFYKGWIRLPIPALDLKNLNPKRLEALIGNQELWPNQFIITESENNYANYRLFRHMGNHNFNEVEPISILHAFGAKNVQQLMALDLLMDDNVKLVTLLGPAGTGKTFLALLVGLYKVAYERMYRKLLVTRPVIPLGADIGYLPGDIQEKLHYWMQPVHDNLEFISSQMLKGTEEYLQLGRQTKDRKPRKSHHDQDRGEQRQQPQQQMQDLHIVERLQRQGILSLEAITYMRGRSIPFQFAFIDEVQNLTPHEVKTIVSRAGEGTKVVLAGDPYQIDSPYLDFSSNGLTVTAEKFKDQSIAGTAFLEVSERSELAKLAAEIL
jgi:PhoH-like ATPase